MVKLALLLTAIVFATQDPAVVRNGTITGILTTASGAPAVRVRVAATAVPRDPADSSAATVSLGETDEQGRYVLENIPPGRYYIVAGRVDMPTFYPGRLERASGTALALSSGSTISGINFVVEEASLRTPEPSASSRTSLRLRVQVEDGGELLASDARNTTIQFTTPDGNKGPELPLNSTSFTVPDQGSAYQVRVVNLPDGYVVKSMTFNGADLTSDVMRIPTPLVRVVTFTGQGDLQEAADRAVQRHNEEARTLSITLSRREATRE